MTRLREDGLDSLGASPVLAMIVFFSFSSDLLEHDPMCKRRRCPGTAQGGMKKAIAYAFARIIFDEYTPTHIGSKGSPNQSITEGIFPVKGSEQCFNLVCS